MLTRVFWLGVMSLVVSLCGWQIYQLCNNWMSSRMIMTLDNNKFNIWDIPFPAVTFCSDQRLQNINNRSFKDEVFNKETEDAINLLCYQFEIHKNVTLKSIDTKHWQHVIKNHKVACEQILLLISWLQDEINSPCDYIQPILTTYGLCYSLNMIPHQQFYDNNDLQEINPFLKAQKGLVVDYNKTVWTPETGYSQNATPFDVPWRVTADTIVNSVRLAFNLKNTNLKGYCTQSGSGLMLFLHNPAEVPVAIQPTAYVTSNSMITISLSASIVRSSSKLKKWSPKIRNCYYQHEKLLKFFKVYTLHNCEIECSANNTLNECGCNAYYQPRDLEVPVCGTENYDCIRESSTIGYSIFSEKVNTSNNLESCKCLPACKDIQYDYETVESYRNWTKYSTINKLNENTAVVLIYFKRKYVIDVRKAPLVPFSELLGNIGGLLGLFIGCSIVSFFEILYFFIIRFYFDQRNQRKAKSKIFPSLILEQKY